MKTQLIKPTQWLVTALLALSLAACASYYPVAVDVNPTVKAKSGVYNGQTLSLSSKSSRENDYVIRIEQNNKAPVVVGASGNIATQLEQALIQGFSTQGAIVESGAPTDIVLEVQEVLATVERGHVSYDVKQQVRMQLILKRDGRTTTKQFRRSAQEEFPGLLHPELDKVKAALNDQLSLMLNDMLTDLDVQHFIKGN
ncbi:MAG: hypothetical protein GX324_11995 [Aeromonadales bacterium]|nr:hypothetical protein [Aeromonadales bacterium]